jgi:hypothetical protein
MLPRIGKIGRESHEPRVIDDSEQVDWLLNAAKARAVVHGQPRQPCWPMGSPLERDNYDD